VTLAAPLRLELVSDPALLVAQRQQRARDEEAGVAGEEREHPVDDGAVALPVELRQVGAVAHGPRSVEHVLPVDPRAGDVLLRDVERRLVRPLARQVERLGARDRQPGVRRRLALHALDVEAQHPARPELDVEHRIEGQRRALAPVAVTLGVAHQAAHAEARRVAAEVGVERSTIGLEASSLRLGAPEALLARLEPQQVDGAGERVRAVEEATGALEHLDALDVVEVVEGGLRLGDAVGQHQPALQRVEAADDEEVVLAEVGLEVDTAHVAQRVADGRGALLLRERPRDDAHRRRRQAQGDVDARRDGRGQRRRPRGALDEDLLGELGARRLRLTVFDRLLRRLVPSVVSRRLLAQGRRGENGRQRERRGEAHRARRVALDVVHGSDLGRADQV
jgi:hypothetical protein